MDGDRLDGSEPDDAWFYSVWSHRRHSQTSRRVHHDCSYLPKPRQAQCLPVTLAFRIAGSRPRSGTADAPDNKFSVSLDIHQVFTSRY